MTTSEELRRDAEDVSSMAKQSIKGAVPLWVWMAVGKWLIVIAEKLILGYNAKRFGPLAGSSSDPMANLYSPEMMKSISQFKSGNLPKFKEQD